MNHLILTDYNTNNCCYPTEFYYPLTTTSTINITSTPYIQIDKVENGFKIKVFSKEYVFETIENMLTFIKKELNDAS